MGDREIRADMRFIETQPLFTSTILLTNGIEWKTVRGPFYMPMKDKTERRNVGIIKKRSNLYYISIAGELSTHPFAHSQKMNVISFLV